MPALSQELCETLPATSLLHGWALGSWNQGLGFRHRATKPVHCHSQAASGCQHFPQGLDTDRLSLNPCPRCSLLVSRILLATPESSQGNGCHLEIDTFELWCWRKLLRVPWTARRSNQSILKEISPEYSLEGLMLKLKLQYFGHLMEELTPWKRPWCWERSKAGEGDDRGWDGWMASLTRWTWVWLSSGIWWWTGKPGVLQSMGSQRVGHNWATELNWKTTATRWRQPLQRGREPVWVLQLLLLLLGRFSRVLAVKTEWFH